VPPFVPACEVPDGGCWVAVLRLGPHISFATHSTFAFFAKSGPPPCQVRASQFPSSGKSLPDLQEERGRRIFCLPTGPCFSFPRREKARKYPFEEVCGTIRFPPRHGKDRGHPFEPPKSMYSLLFSTNRRLSTKTSDGVGVRPVLPPYSFSLVEGK